MKLEIVPENETRRQTGNRAWSMPNGSISHSLARQALELKGLIQRDMAAVSVERANGICNLILEVSKDVAKLETEQIAGGIHG
ncbi:hypothetical protein [Pseudodesulfovibrio indicus]|uniref:Uncharacterized protein n=1 Tax=Pseudodesulfovibrio indicus TaxID=1716143 RepID=A0A140D8V6_9BACT|nr:hypothetical protein [Pseudodesulfovibrio indicus]AMK09623.1 hypothetical protein AWY79_00120 [Pseudodesulfovibrio indicus]TDT86429.1 hypothetical protein EDC59_113105 [Pseudodesulfovibrio indicus]